MIHRLKRWFLFHFGKKSQRYRLWLVPAKTQIFMIEAYIGKYKYGVFNSVYKAAEEYLPALNSIKIMDDPEKIKKLISNERHQTAPPPFPELK